MIEVMTSNYTTARNLRSRNAKFIAMQQSSVTPLNGFVSFKQPLNGKAKRSKERHGKGSKTNSKEKAKAKPSKEKGIQNSPSAPRKIMARTQLERIQNEKDEEMLFRSTNGAVTPVNKDKPVFKSKQK